MRAVQARSWLATYPNPEHGVTVEWVQAFTNTWFTPEALAEWVQLVRNLRDDSAAFSRVAVLDGSIVGLVHAVTGADGRVELKSVYVDPERIGTGIGAQLMRAADEWIGNRQVWLDVAVYNNRAIHFYELHGFTVVDAEPQLACGVIPVIIMERACP
jgi:ribosomal protein S18 acetylase RimI-like enzyme